MSRERQRNRVTFPIVDAHGTLVLEERRKSDRRRYGKSPPKYPIKDCRGELVTGNRRRTVDRRVRRTQVVADPRGPRLPKILLDTGEALYELNCDGRVLTLGRSPVCDVVVNRPHVSREHARIERDGDRFILHDRSRNGTSVRPQGGRPVVVRGRSIELKGQGLLCLGKAVDERAHDELIRYAVIPRF